ncbi:MAG: hypothetical protein A2426_02970, partial [Candidatus Lambdaproteobacteria bacterium RIFOXYC1_FULL_56_13]
ARRPGLETVLTTNTPTALAMAQAQGQPVFYKPFDFSLFASLLLGRLQPNLLVLVETELWPNLTRVVSRKIPMVLVNGRLSDQHFESYRKFRFLFAPLLGRISRILAGDATSAQRFGALGAKVELLGNLKWGSTAAPDPVLVQRLREQLGLQPDEFVFVAGSLQPEELAVLVPAGLKMAQGHPKFRALLVPRHPDKRAEFVAQSQALGVELSLTSQGSCLGAQWVLADQMGLLTALYSLASFVFVGGSFCNRGGQNMIEPVGLGKPTVVGPYTANFAEPVALLSAAQGLAVVQDADALVALSQSPSALESLGSNGLHRLQREEGAWTRTIEVLDEVLGPLV